MVDKFEVGKKYITSMAISEKDIATCIAISSRGQPILEWDHSGVVHILITPQYWMEYKEPKRGTVWVNIYLDSADNDIHNSLESANRYTLSNRLACVEVPWVEGQGLE